MMALIVPVTQVAAGAAHALALAADGAVYSWGYAQYDRHRDDEGKLVAPPLLEVMGAQSLP